MLIKQRRWLLVALVYVLAPIAGLMVGVFGGLQLVDEAHDDGAVVETEEVAEQESATVTMPEGHDVSLEQIAPGANLAVVVMKDADCPVCQRQLKRMSDDLREFQRRGGTVVGLSDADVQENRELIERLDLKFPIVSDADHELLGELEMTLPERSHVMPGIVFVDGDGEVEHIHQGRSPGQCQEGMVIEWLEGS